ncbi:hypothetical protein [Polyangium spumosum]|nr:hypothetical protein [Polyangium spumosum]
MKLYNSVSASYLFGSADTDGGDNIVEAHNDAFDGRNFWVLQFS